MQGREERSAQAEVAAEPAAAVARFPARAALSDLTPATILQLQRSAGNAAVVSTVRRAGLVTLSEAAARLQRAREAHPGNPKAAGVRFRLPQASELKALYSGGLVPQSVVEGAVLTALRRMD